MGFEYLDVTFLKDTDYLFSRSYIHIFSQCFEIHLYMLVTQETKNKVIVFTLHIHGAALFLPAQIDAVISQDT